MTHLPHGHHIMIGHPMDIIPAKAHLARHGGNKMIISLFLLFIFLRYGAGLGRGEAGVGTWEEWFMHTLSALDVLAGRLDPARESCAICMFPTRLKHTAWWGTCTGSLSVSEGWTTVLRSVTTLHCSGVIGLGETVCFWDSSAMMEEGWRQQREGKCFKKNIFSPHHSPAHHPRSLPAATARWTNLKQIINKPTCRENTPCRRPLIVLFHRNHFWGLFLTD